MQVSSITNLAWGARTITCLFTFLCSEHRHVLMASFEQRDSLIEINEYGSKYKITIIPSQSSISKEKKKSVFNFIFFKEGHSALLGNNWSYKYKSKYKHKHKYKYGYKYNYYEHKYKYNNKLRSRLTWVEAPLGDNWPHKYYLCPAAI